MRRLHGAVLILLSFACAGCCTSVSPAPAPSAAGEPAVILGGISAGWIAGIPPPSRPRALETWEIRIWPDGTVQEARGWKGEDGVLPPMHIGAAAAQRIIDEARPIAALPEIIGDYVTDTPHRAIEIASGTGRHLVMAFPVATPNAETEQFDRIWTSIARRFPERTVCRNCKCWSPGDGSVSR